VLLNRPPRPRNLFNRQCLPSKSQQRPGHPLERPIGYRDGRVDRDIRMGGEENRRHRLLTLPLAADIHYRRETSGGTDHFDEHRKRRIADQILFVPRAARRQRDRTIEQPRHLQRNRKFVDSPLEGDGFEPSVPRSRVAGRGQAARNQIFRRTTSVEAYVRRNKAADRLVRRAPDQPSRNLPSRPFPFRHQRARPGAWHGADDLRWQRS
jgi:hypothetical protein